MSYINFLYGKGSLGLEIDDNKLDGVLESGLHAYTPSADELGLVKAAMATPYGGKTLRERAEGKQRVVIIASDHTRPVPSKIIIPPMLSEIREGNPNAEITILIATGAGRCLQIPAPNFSTANRHAPGLLPENRYTRIWSGPRARQGLNT